MASLNDNILSKYIGHCPECVIDVSTHLTCTGLFIFIFFTILKGPTASNQAINIKYSLPLLENKTGNKKTIQPFAAFWKAVFLVMDYTHFSWQRKLLKITFWGLATTILIWAIKLTGKGQSCGCNLCHTVLFYFV